MDIFKKLYDLFIKIDGTLIEINPLAEDVSGEGIFFFKHKKKTRSRNKK